MKALLLPLSYHYRVGYFDKRLLLRMTVNNVIWRRYAYKIIFAYVPIIIIIIAIAVVAGVISILQNITMTLSIYMLHLIKMIMVMIVRMM